MSSGSVEHAEDMAMNMDDPPPPDHDAHSSASEDESEPEAAADLMVVSRARRSNAGNRMSTLLAQASEEAEWGEEWEEVANEEEFVGDEANDQDDFNLDSSSSEDEDEGGEHDDDGEKELRKIERQERTKKRKTATNPFAARLAAVAHKKVKLDVAPSDTQPAPAPRPKKKSERASWIPTPEDGPLRTSSRKQTMANKEHTLAKLKEKDKRRDDTLAMMKAAEARKAKDEVKPMTQAERLAEAAKTERVNSKSLHRWVEAEEQRAAERQAKLDALKNRQIEGPFIRYYSGPAIWVDNTLKHTGKGGPKLEDLEEKYNKDLSLGAEASRPLSGEQSSMPGLQQQQFSFGSSDQAQTTQGPPTFPLASQSQAPQPETQMSQVKPSPESQIQMSQPPTQDHSSGPYGTPYSSSIMFAPPQSSESFLFGIEQYAMDQQGTAPQSNSQHLPQPHITQNETQPQPPSTETHQNGLVHIISPPIDRSNIPPNPFSSNVQQSPFSQPHPSLSDPSLAPNAMNPQSLLQQFQCPPAPPVPKQRRIIRRALRNLLILSSFPNLDTAALITTKSRTTSSTVKDKDKSALIQLSMTLFSWTTADATAFVTQMLNAPKPTKKAEKALLAEGLMGRKKELCGVTNMVARYRDPQTGIAYRDQRAFKVLRGVVGGGFVWSGALGCYVGGRASGGSGRVGGGIVRPAVGVPARFISMEGAKPTPPTLAAGQPAGEAEAGNTNVAAKMSAPATTGKGGQQNGDGTVKVEG